MTGFVRAVGGTGGPCRSYDGSVSGLDENVRCVKSFDRLSTKAELGQLCLVKYEKLDVGNYAW